MSEPTPAAKSAREILTQWANSQNHWVRAIVREVLETNKPLSEKAVDAAYKEALANYDLHADSPRPEPKLVLAATDEERGEKLVIRSLCDVANVNRLAPSQNITFSPRMTVLFGENATGKSGYVRILKRLAAVRSAEEILPDIGATSKPGTPSAKIEYALGEKQATYEWSGESGAHPFSRASVFDSRAVDLHLEGDLTYVYTPRDLALFKYSHEAITGVRDRLEKARDAVRPTDNPFLTHFNAESSIYPKIETLGAATDLPTLELLADVSDEEQGNLETLRSTVNALRSDTITARLEVARSDRELYDAVHIAATVIANFNWATYAKGAGKIRELDNLLTSASKTAFDGEDIPNVLSPPWRAFIESANTYAKHLGQEDYPHTGDRCLYCRQELGESALALVRKYLEYCNNTYRADRDQEKANLEVLSQPVRDLDPEQLRVDITKKIAALDNPDHPPEILTTARTLADEIEALVPKVNDKLVVEHCNVVELAVALQPLAKTQLETIDAQVTALTTQGADRSAALAKESVKLRELEDRLTVKQHLSAIRTYVEKAKWASRADDLLRTRFRTILRNLTETSKIASEDLLNQDFEKHFKKESEALRAPPVNLAFPGRAGEAARRKSLASSGHHLGDVLSEGEQKVIALADFLSESAIRTISAPLIFDDPVNSLDYKRLEYIADRLFELSREHQVILFTHSILLAMAIIDRFEKAPNDCAYFDVSLDAGGAPGIVTGGKHPRYDTPKVLRGEINSLVQEINKAVGANQQALIERAYSRLRSWCEAVVEEEILAGVTKRYQPNVRMTVLPKIHGDKLKAVTYAILPLFEKACRITEAHAQPAETLSTHPTASEFAADWKAALDSLTAYKS